jgi:hypothetical protein
MTQALTPHQNFSVFQRHPHPPEGIPAGNLWEFEMSTVPVPDLPVTARNARIFGHQVGQGRWPNRRGLNDRFAYFGAVAFWEHEDPGHHDFVAVLRFTWLADGATGLLINDKYMIEDPFNTGHESQGMAPYPYLDRTLPVDRTHPGAIVEVFHKRPRLAAGTEGGNPQLLQRFTIPAVEPDNPNTLWYYQDSGKIVAVNSAFVTPENPDGAIAKLIISTMHGAGGPTPAYTYRIQ